MSAPAPVDLDEIEGGRISPAEFALLRDVIHRGSGILLSEGKTALLVARLARRLRTLGLGSYMEYYDHLMSGDDPDEHQRMLDLVSTNETRFFREPAQFRFLEDVVIPAWKGAVRAGVRGPRVRAWSAACSTGEEAYSVAMSLLAHLSPSAGWDLRVTGTDLSRSALERAAEGVWSSVQARHLPPPYLKKYMRRGTRSREGSMTATGELREVLRFGQLNLTEESYPMERDLDLILCRNVLIYFDQDTRESVLRRLVEHLAPGGYLFLGHAEGTASSLDGLERAGTMTFRKPGGAS